MVVLGCDISHWQGIVDFPKMSGAGIRVCYIKATDGTLKDVKFVENWKNAKSWVRRGAYHFYRPEIKASLQIDNFLNSLGSDVGEVCPMLDVEVNTKLVSQAAFRAGIRLWLGEVEKSTKMRPCIYTRASFWDPQLGHPSWARMYPWVVADYRGYVVPDVPLPCNKLWGYQYTEKGPGATYGVQSASIDLDRFYED